jgi:hypothetical protein
MLAGCSSLVLLLIGPKQSSEQHGNRLLSPHRARGRGVIFSALCAPRSSWHASRSSQLRCFLDAHRHLSQHNGARVFVIGIAANEPRERFSRPVGAWIKSTEPARGPKTRLKWTEKAAAELRGLVGGAGVAPFTNLDPPPLST